MRIQHNIMAMNAYRNLNNNNSALSSNLEKLSSGYRINRAGDDAAGLAISEKMRAQITGLDVAQDNAQSGINLVQTAEGALTEVHDMLNRMYELAEQSANGTYDDTDRVQLQKEVAQLQTEINRIADSANFNGINLLDGGLTNKDATMTTPTDALVNMMDGVTIDAPVQGAGKKQEYSVTFDNLKNFGAGDEISFDLLNADGTVSDTVTVTVGTGGITGATLDDQMNSLVAALNSNASFTGAGYTASLVTSAGADGSVQYELKFSALNDGEMNLSIGNFKATDKQTTVKAEITTAGSYGTSTDAEDREVTLFNGTATQVNLQAGDKLKFDFTIDGVTQSVTLEIGTGAGQVNIAPDATVTDAMNAIISALSNAKFDKNDDTGALLEENLNLSDYLTASTTDGLTISFDAKTGGTYAEVVADVSQVEIFKQGATTATTTIAAANGTSAAAGAAAATNVVEVGITGPTGAGDMSIGEQITIEGVLADGRKFSVTLEASDQDDYANGKFNATNSVTSLVSALKNADTKVIITDASGATSVMTADKLFDSADYGFTVSESGGKLAFTSSEAGAVGAGFRAQVNTVSLGTKAFTATFTTNAIGKDQSQAENTLTLDKDLIEQGTSLTIDGKTYEFVTDTNYLTNTNNQAVLVTNLNDKNAITNKDLAEALAKAMVEANGGTWTPGATNATYTGASGSAAGGAYQIEVGNDGITIKSDAVGENAFALDVKMNESKPTSVLNFTSEPNGTRLDPDKKTLNLNVGDTVTINGKVYEFTDGSRTKNEDAIQVDVSGLSKTGDDKVDAETVAQALADAVNKNDGDQTIARVDGDSVVFTSKYNENAATGETGYEAPEIELPEASRELTLQIGDTSASYNQLTVEIKDCHADSLGVEDLDISNQAGAQAALDKIKSAINYVSDVRGTLGATQNRLDHTINNLSVMEENIQDAESNIRDTDVAEEMMEYTKNNILIQSAQAMLAQANQVPQGVLQLLG